MIIKLKTLTKNAAVFFAEVDPNWKNWYPTAEQKLEALLDLQDSDLRKAVTRLNDRIYTLLKIQIAQKLIQTSRALSTFTTAQLIQLYHQKGGTDKEKEIKTLFKWALLKLIAQIYGNSGEYQSWSGEFFSSTQVETGNSDHFGCVGMTPLWYLNMFEHKSVDVNLRELMYLTYRYISSLTCVIHFNNIEFISDANSALTELQATWVIDDDFITDYTAPEAFTTDQKRISDFGVLNRSAYCNFTRDEALRIPTESKSSRTVDLPNPSIREQIALGSQWRGQGAADKFSLNPHRSMSHPYVNQFLSSVDADQFFHSGPSGMTDSVLTVCLCLGINNKEFLTDIRLAMIITMLKPKDHNVIEIGFSSMGFQLPFSLASEEQFFDSLLSLKPEVRPQQRTRL